MRAGAVTALLAAGEQLHTADQSGVVEPAITAQVR